MSVAGRVVRFAVLLLPEDLRPRYREQWTSDLRDAAEAGISDREIAGGALAFALTVARPTPWGGSAYPTAATIERRSRFAAGLALSAAVLGVAGYATSLHFRGGTGIEGVDAFIGAASGLVLAFQLTAPIVAVAIVSRTRAAQPRVRLAVWMLVLAGLAPVAQLLIDSALLSYDMLLRPGNLAYLVAATLVGLALRLLWTGLDRGAPGVRRPAVLAMAVSAVTVLAVGALTLGYGAIVWASRQPLEFSWLPATSGTRGPDGKMVWVEIPATRAMYLEWLELEAQFERHVGLGFAAVTVGTVALAAAVVVLARTLRIRPSILTAAAVAAILIASSALLSLLQYGGAMPPVPPEALLVAGQWLVIAVILFGVGDLRSARRRPALEPIRG